MTSQEVKFDGFTVCVDPDRCQGHNRCVVLAPDIFTTDEFGYASIKDEATDVDLEEVQVAEQNCPERAITVTVWGDEGFGGQEDDAG
jgi:ferredoxin